MSIVTSGALCPTMSRTMRGGMPRPGTSVTQVCRKSWNRTSGPSRSRIEKCRFRFRGEETGVHVEVGELTGVHKSTPRGIVALVFRRKPSGGTEHTANESKAVS